MQKHPTKRIPWNKESVETRFWKHVKKTDSCWIWTGSLFRRPPYGMIRWGDRMVSTHRVSWIMHKGPIPTGLCVLHHCDNPPCVNPEHLWLGTKTENNLDRDSKGRGNIKVAHDVRRLQQLNQTHCKRGHPLSGDNLRIGTNGRNCLTCKSWYFHHPELIHPV